MYLYYTRNRENYNINFFTSILFFWANVPTSIYFLKLWSWTVVKNARVQIGFIIAMIIASGLKDSWIIADIADIIADITVSSVNGKLFV